MQIGDLILRFTAPAVLLVLVVVFLRRRFYREFPLFLTYILVALVVPVMRVAVRNQPVSYFVVYWTADAILGVLALLALNEVFKHLFESDYEDHWWFRLVLPTAALLIALLFLGQPLRPTA